MVLQLCLFFCFAGEHAILLWKYSYISERVSNLWPRVRDMMLIVHDLLPHTGWRRGGVMCRFIERSFICTSSVLLLVMSFQLPIDRQKIDVFSDRYSVCLRVHSIQLNLDWACRIQSSCSIS